VTFNNAGVQDEAPFPSIPERSRFVRAPSGQHFARSKMRDIASVALVASRKPTLAPGVYSGGHDSANTTPTQAEKQTGLGRSTVYREIQGLYKA
jgi:hypothetical protein